MKQKLIASVLFVACAFATRAGTAPAGGTQTAQSFTAPGEGSLGYWLYLPQDYGKTFGKRWPLMLFLHGAGERGDNLELVKKHGPPKLIAAGKQFPFIIVAPQCPTNQWWSPKLLSALLDETTRKYAVDADRVYLTGLSMGGFGTWALGAEQPQRFAALAPICGGGNPQLASRLKGVPIWVFHGARDKTVSPERSQAMVDALKAVGGNVKFTVYDDAEHDSWTRTYDDPKFFEWLLQQHRPLRGLRR